MLIRDIGIYVAGMLTLAHEVLITEGERPWVLTLIAGLLGLPTFLRMGGRNGPPPDPTPPREPMP